MHPYLPDLGELAAVVLTWGVGAVLLLAGRLVAGGRTAPEMRIGAGWGALCLLLTLWGVFVPVSLRLPATAFAAAAICSLLSPRYRLARVDSLTVAKMLVLTTPLWLVMAPIRPSQPDTFLNLLPNATYLVDYGRFPTIALPPSYSYLPSAPYNTQFLSFLGALVAPGYPASGMSLINVMLFLAAGLAIARALHDGEGEKARPLPWGAIALGMLLAVALNPGFVPRVDFTAFGEPALMVTALLSASLLVRAQGALVAGGRPSGLVALSLILAAMINSKQSGIGLGVALLAAAALAGAAERGLPWRRWLRFLALAALPAALLYAAWRYHVTRAGLAELMLLPPGAWHWAVLPQTVASVAWSIFEKPFYFAGVVIALAALPVALRRCGWTMTTRLLAVHAGLFVFYNAFLLLAYVMTFSGGMSAAAHSYFRYNTHLSLVLVLALAMAAREAGLGAILARHARRWTALALAAQLAAPIAFAQRLRFDLVMPQPLVWNLGVRVKPYLKDGDRLALLLPGDNGSVAAMLAGVLRDVPPRRRLDLWVRPTADSATLGEAARRGYELALVSCSADGLVGSPPGVAGLFAHDKAGWGVLAQWPYPAAAFRQRWQDILSWRPLCRKR
ncbi:MAG TPA: hypothetical protein VGR91_10355 [Stellaceae bacterium]|nr:hypothetical protein [Stellaceae bacterium]